MQSYRFYLLNRLNLQKSIFAVSINFITLGRLYRWTITSCKSIKQEKIDVIIKIIGAPYGIINTKGTKDNTIPDRICGKELQITP